MKKVIALALAMMLTMSLSSVAFAAETDSDKADKMRLATDRVYAEDKNGEFSRIKDSGAAGFTLAPGKVAYIPILVQTPTRAGEAVDANKDAVKKLKVYADWSVGKTDAPTIEYKKLKDVGYCYVVAVKMPEGSSTKEYDLAGSLGIGRTKTLAMDGTGSDKRDIGFGATVKYADATGYDINDDSGVVVDFNDGDTDIELTWGDSLASFEVNVAGQSDLNLDYSTKFDVDFAAKYDYANIDFLKFTKTPSFNRTGEMKIYAEPDMFLYEVTADGAKAVKDAKYDENEGAFIFKTRTLGSYAISDKELKTVTSSSSSSSTSGAPSEMPGSSSTPTTGKPNPDTGR